MTSDIHLRIREKAARITDPAGRELAVLEDPSALEISALCGPDLHEIYREALGIGVYPGRYVRNLDVISPTEQLKLAEAQVAVAGAGGLGGQVILLLARIGVGRLVVVDHDRFDETNLNRQALCSRETLNRPKAEAAVEVVASVNPGVRVIPHRTKIGASNAESLLAGADVIVDALDNVPDRLVLQERARRLGVPLVHGALAGFEGRVMTIYPGDPGLEQLYEPAAAEADPERPEALLGVPAVTAAVVGSLQAMEVLKILLHRGKPFRQIMAHIDLESGRFEEFRFDGTGEGGLPHRESKPPLT
ncbi:MAG TPA: HesA/MoeB/ThiF family protein [Syntrophales bacterium]|nr:HesA/MoeB/ThiF family protein [Syntrophales bacterium]